MVLVLTFKIVRWFVVEIWQKVALEGSLTSWWTDKGFSSTNKQSWKLLTFDNFCQQKTKTVQRTLPVFFITINETKILFNTLSQPAPLVISSSETKRSNWKNGQPFGLQFQNPFLALPTFPVRTYSCSNSLFFSLSELFAFSSTFTFFGFIRFHSQGEMVFLGKAEKRCSYI